MSTYTVIMNCDELLAHLFEAYGNTIYACGGHIEFQGDICEVGGFMPDIWCTLMPSPKFPKTIFAIDDYDNTDEEFILYVYKGDAFVLDQTLAVKLPNYVKDELIATIQGYN